VKTKKVKEKPPLYITLADRTDPDLGFFYKITAPEQNFINALERFGGGLPVPVCEYRFSYPRRHRADFAFPHAWLIVECDGGVHKQGGGKHGQDDDRRKLNLAAVLGWRVLRFSADMLADDPAGCIEVVRLALSVVKLNELIVPIRQS